MKKLLKTAMAVFACASISHAYTFEYAADSTWTSNSYESTDVSFSKAYFYYADGVQSEFDNSTYPGESTNGVGQIFDVTNTFTVKTIRILSQRYYNTNDLYLTIYKNVVLDPLTTNTPSLYMIPENIVAQFTWDPGDSAPQSSGGPGNVINLNLETNEYFDLSPLGTLGDYTNYYFHIDFEDVDYGTNIPWRLFIWNVDGGDTNGYFITPDGLNQDAANGRDLGIAFESTNPPVVELPEIPTNWILPHADTYVRHYESGKTGTNYGDATDFGTRNYVSWRDYNAYVRFDLTSYAGMTITNASFTIIRRSGDGIDNDRVRFLGLDNVVSNTPQDWGEYTLTGDSVGAEHVDLNAVTNATDGLYTNRLTDFELGPTNVIETISGDEATLSGGALVDWLNTRLADADTNGNIYVTFIVDMPIWAPNKSVYWYSRENIDTIDQDKLPHLIIEGIPAGPVGPQFDPTITSIAISAGTVTIGWDSDSNGTYRVENKSALTDGSWNPVAGATNLTGGAGQSTPVTASGANEEFFRIYGQ